MFSIPRPAQDNIHIYLGIAQVLLTALTRLRKFHELFDLLHHPALHNLLQHPDVQNGLGFLAVFKQYATAQYQNQQQPPNQQQP
jgi:hypothetical protein